MRTLLLIAAATVLPLATAHAQQCGSLGQRDSFAQLNVARVKQGQARLPFLKEDCAPSASRTCESTAFVVPGDVVLVGEVFDASACAAYINARGQTTVGLLANDRLESTRPLPKAVPATLVGTWTRTEAEIVIKPKGRSGVLTFSGNATYGALDPNRVERGAVNIGAFDFDLKPASNSVAAALKSDGTGSTAPVAAGTGSDTDCEVAMIALGPYLAVEDNRMCGGANVSFTGLYRRAK